MRDESFSIFERNRKEKLNQISDSNLKGRLINLYKVFKDTHEKSFRMGTVARLPQFYKKEILEIFSKKDKALMSYLLCNIDYLREFMGDLKALNPIFEALCDRIDILTIYKLFSYFPDDFLKYFVDNFGSRFNYIINEYISLNIEHFIGDTLISRSELHWKVVMFVCGNITEDISNFFQPNRDKVKVIFDLDKLAGILVDWVNNGFVTKIPIKSIALPILEKMKENDVPNIVQIFNAYKSERVLVKTSPEYLANKEITVYQGTVSKITHIDQKKITYGFYKGLISQSADIIVILTDVKIIPSIKKPHELFKEDIELELEELIISISPTSFTKNTLKIGDRVYCNGKMDSKPEYGPYKLIHYLNTRLGSYDIIEHRTLQDYQINEYVALKWFNYRVSYIYVKGNYVTKWVSDKGVDDMKSTIELLINKGVTSTEIPYRIFRPLLKELLSIDQKKFKKLLNEDFIRRFSEGDHRDRVDLMYFLHKNRNLIDDNTLLRTQYYMYEVLNVKVLKFWWEHKVSNVIEFAKLNVPNIFHEDNVRYFEKILFEPNGELKKKYRAVFKVTDVVHRYFIPIIRNLTKVGYEPAKVLYLELLTEKSKYNLESD